jgi:hypothetical protein
MITNSFVVKLDVQEKSKHEEITMVICENKRRKKEKKVTVYTIDYI